MLSVLAFGFQNRLTGGFLFIGTFFRLQLAGDTLVPLTTTDSFAFKTPAKNETNSLW
jgi:hypothetical protein